MVFCSFRSIILKEFTLTKVTIELLKSDRKCAASALLDRLWDVAEALRDFPEIGPARPEIAPDARSLTVGNYLILYRVHRDTVEIVRVLHGAQFLDDVWE